MDDLAEELDRSKSNIFANLRGARGRRDRGAAAATTGARSDQFALRGKYPDVVVVGAYLPARLRLVVADKVKLCTRAPSSMLGDARGRRGRRPPREAIGTLAEEVRALRRSSSTSSSPRSTARWTSKALIEALPTSAAVDLGERRAEARWGSSRANRRRPAAEATSVDGRHGARLPCSERARVGGGPRDPHPGGFDPCAQALRESASKRFGIRRQVARAEAFRRLDLTRVEKSPRPAHLEKTIREIIHELLEMPITPHVRELRAKAVTYGRVINNWSIYAPTAPQTQAMLECVTELEEKVAQAKRGEVSHVAKKPLPPARTEAPPAMRSEPGRRRDESVPVPPDGVAWNANVNAGKLAPARDLGDRRRPRHRPPARRRFLRRPFRPRSIETSR